MANKSFKVTGRLFWTKVLGDPVLNYNEDGNEWTFDLALDDNNVNEIKKLGLGERLKNKGDDRGQFLMFKRHELNKARGTNNKPIPVVDPAGKTWPNDKSIGNGSLAVITFGTFEWPKRGKSAAGIKAVPYEIKVMEHVEYVRPEKPYVGDNDHGDAIPTKTENWKE